MWGRLKGQVMKSKEDVDASDEDTIISRALVRYYAPEVPSWLVTSYNAMEPRSTESSSFSNSPTQSFVRRDSNADQPRMFERSDSFASSANSSQTRANPPSASGLASRLKNTKW